MVSSVVAVLGPLETAIHSVFREEQVLVSARLNVQRENSRNNQIYKLENSSFKILILVYRVHQGNTRNVTKSSLFGQCKITKM